MGKFNIRKVEKKEKEIKRLKEEQIKLSLQTKPLLSTIPKKISKDTPIRDGILLFGKHKGKKITELMNSWENSSYVFDYLLLNKDLPKKFRNQVSDIIDNQDPFDEDQFNKHRNLSLRIKEVEVESDSSDNKMLFGYDDNDDDIPW